MKPGDIFVAVPGSKVDGSKYISSALENGAAWIVAQKQNELISDKVVIHDNPAVALGYLARAFYNTDKLDMSIIGITGTNGKTTVSYLLEHIFISSGLNTGVVGTVNYRWMGKSTEASMTTPD
ncbi:MAG: Mur ligase domain-containing protein, partial [Desulfonatronovibrio sp.]